jgi:hypothetical protein
LDYPVFFRSIMRVLRGIVKTAIIWAAVWAPASLVPMALAELSGVHFPSGVFLRVLIFQTVIGAINGGVFASAIAFGGRRKTFETLSLRWIAACGAVGGALFPLILRAALGAPMPPIAVAWGLATNAALGAGLATLTLFIARRAPVLTSGYDSSVEQVATGASNAALRQGVPTTESMRLPVKQ